MTGKSAISSLLIAMLIGSLSYVSFAQSKPASKSNNLSSYPAKQKAVHHVKNETGGRVLDVKQHKGKFWRVKFLKDGKIQYMDVAPHSFSD